MEGVRRAVGVLVLLAAGCTTSTPYAPPQGSWSALPPAPLSARHGALAVAVDGRAVVLGGDVSPLCPPGASCTDPARYVSDGAVYDPATRTWTRMEPAPVPVAQHGSAAALGSSLYVLQPAPDGRSAVLLEYDTRADRWSRPPTPPAPAHRRLLTVGDRLVATSSGADPVVGMVLEDGAWRPLPPAPFPPAQHRQLGAAGDRLVLLSADAGPPLEQAAAYLRAAVYDFRSGWRALPDTEQLVYGNTVPLEWNGEQAVLADPYPAAAGGEGSPGNGKPAGGFLDLDTGRWTLLPEPPERPEGFPVLASSTRLVGGFGLLLDTRQRRWTSIDDTDLAASYQSAQTWVGDALLVWGGGSIQGGAPVATGALWSPG